MIELDQARFNQIKDSIFFNSKQHLVQAMIIPNPPL